MGGIVSAVVLGAVLGSLWRRDLSYLARVAPRLGWLAIVGLAMQSLAVRQVPPGDALPDARGLLLLAGNLVVLVALVADFDRWPARVLALGLALNLIACLPQGGYMPITAEAYAASGQARPEQPMTPGSRSIRGKDIFLPTDRTPFAPLSDVIPVAEPLLFQGVYSPGDLLIALGVAGLAAGLGVRRRSQEASSLDPAATNHVPERRPA